MEDLAILDSKNGGDSLTELKKWVERGRIAIYGKAAKFVVGEARLFFLIDDMEKMIQSFRRGDNVRTYTRIWEEQVEDPKHG